MAAAFSRHLAAAADHLAAAARDLAGAARAAARRREDDVDDIELPDLPSPSPDPSNTDDDDTDEDMLAVLEHSYELFGVLLGVGIPVPIYFAVPEETRASAAWVWSVFTYAVAFTIGVTAISVRVFRSRCCLSTALRSLLLVFCLIAEVFAAFHFLPTARSNRWVAGGACFSILHLVAIYLGVWAWPRRRR